MLRDWRRRGGRGGASVASIMSAKGRMERKGERMKDGEVREEKRGIRENGRS